MGQGSVKTWTPANPSPLDCRATLIERARWKLHQPSLAETQGLQSYAAAFSHLQRHEAALSRSVSRNLHELQCLQALRAGEHVPPPAVVDVDVNIERNGSDSSEP